MEVGNEISQKIRSAIKAKLVDLGAYVDDELPDYIMVMVANKKSQAQMTEDLNLFLGNNTERFTAWLNALLTKLKSITAEKETNKPSTEESQAPKEPEPSGSGTHVEPQAETEIKSQDEEGEVDQEPELHIRPEQDEFEEEDRALKAAQQKKEAQTAAPSTKPKQVPPVPSLKVSVTNKQPRVAVTSPIRPAKEASTKISPKTRTVSTISTKSQEGAGTSQKVPGTSQKVSRKRKVPGSVVGSVVKHQVEEEEEEYDPYRPLVGRVSSVVKVGRRRPSVPPSRQANKSLLIRAVTDAHKSTEKSPQSTTKEPRSREHMKLGPKARSMVHRLQQSSRPPTRRDGTRSHTEGRSVQLFSRSKREEVIGRLKWNVEGELDENSDKTDEGYIEQSDPDDTLDVSYDDVRQVEHVAEAIIQEQKEAAEEEEDQRRVAVKEEFQEEPLELELQPDLETLIESGAEESDFTDGEESVKRTVQESTPVQPEKRSSSPKFVVTLDGIDTFAMEKEMSLDLSSINDEGDTDTLDTQTDTGMIEEEDSLRARNIVKVKPRVASHIPEVDFSFEDDDYSMEESPPKKARMPTRCKFWPLCKNGNSCEFHHPTVPCKTFPKCKYGDKCLYVHPNCKFDANCTRPNCPFTHASVRIAAAHMPVLLQPIKVLPPISDPTYMSTPLPVGSQPQGQAQSATGPSQIKCKFFPKCTNMNCHFLHPKPCRYGVSCNVKETCPFTHPKLPTMDQLRWTANRNSLSSATGLR